MREARFAVIGADGAAVEFPTAAAAVAEVARLRSAEGRIGYVAEVDATGAWVGTYVWRQGRGGAPAMKFYRGDAAPEGMPKPPRSVVRR